MVYSINTMIHCFYLKNTLPVRVLCSCGGRALALCCFACTHLLVWACVFVRGNA